MLTGERVVEARRRLLARIDRTAAEAEAGFPHAADGRTGRWDLRPEGSWTGGFWVGSCRLAHALMRALHYVPEGRPADAADGGVRHLDDLPDLLARLC